ncbi:hypothetical protein SAMN05421770_10372 [Granulicella rosea]|uniref:Outer membrane protein beta-barrel domain-containing protein n=1 Tax=Granulicella rosea TaxID=474952 RepID=A0A239IEP8_9BACT|nr:hypothetical protein [Granulicella rosea]SNS91902.1 hypothetical protein SAMN05421770_10372 [Granulicella rosea]
MRSLPALFLAFSAFLIPAAHAQYAVYGTASLTGYGFNDGNGNTAFKKDSGGPTGGVFYNFPIQSRLSAGIDARATYSPGNNGGTAELVGLRIGFVPHKVRLRPYFQIGGGVVSSSEQQTVYHYSPTGAYTGYTLQSTRYTSGAAEILFGLDVRLTDSFDLRALEWGAAAGASSVNSPSVAFVNTGVVYHFPSRGRK